MMTRRGMFRSGVAVGAGGAFAWASGFGGAAFAEDDPALRTPVLVGANPAVQLFADGSCTAYASCWRVDWSTHGPGTAIVLWRPTGVSVHTDRPALGHWLADSFVRHFPELEGLPWTTPRFRPAPARVDVDLARGLRARAGALSVVTAGVLDRRTFATDDFPLGGVPHSLSLVLGPCATGAIRLGGRELPGEIERGGTPER
ncbi:MAG TPA: hypothetical protein VFO49_07125, partial [Nocardioides sp.]|nr:hypothetical protein [Nocardioides sp.]